MTTRIFFLIFISVSILSFTSCFKDHDTVTEENDNEVITTIEVHLTEAGTNNEQTFSIDYPDGYGVGVTPVKQTISIAANKVYDAEIILLDKTKNPVDTTSAEVAEENMDHRFYFEPSANSNITVDDFDTDDNGVSVGLHSKWTTTGAASGTIVITLRHYPNGSKIESDPINSTKSSTDLSVEFNTEVK